MKKLAIIGAGDMAKIIAVRAKELGIETHCFAWIPGAVAKDFVDQFHPISIFETQKICTVCREIGINGVVATTELTVHIAAIIADELGLIGNPLSVTEDITNKYKNRQKVSKVENLYQPQYCLAHNTAEITEKNLTFPLIIKPQAEGGKRGISVVHNATELSQAFEYCLSESKDKNSGVLVEEFLHGGVEYSVESLSFHKKHYVIQITQKDSSGAPHCVELGHHQPAALSEHVKKNVITVIHNLLDAVGVANGPTHTEIKIIDDKIYLIEINARPGGDCISYPLTELSTGYPFMTGVIEIALGTFQTAPELAFKQFAGIYFVTEQTSYLKPVWDVCENYPWCYQKMEYEKKLQVLVHNTQGKNYFIYCDMQGNPIPQLLQTLK